MKLTEDDVEIIDKILQDSALLKCPEQHLQDFYCKFHLRYNEQIKQQILDNQEKTLLVETHLKCVGCDVDYFKDRFKELQEKAEKYNSFSTTGIVKDNHELREENKQLKQVIDEIRERLESNTGQTNYLTDYDLKQILSKLEEKA